MKHELPTDRPSSGGAATSSGGDLQRLLERARQFLESRAQRPAAAESPRSGDALAEALRAALRDEPEPRLDRIVPA